MYAKEVVQELVDFVRKMDGVADKKIVADTVRKQFNLVRDRSVFYCEWFAVRFCSSKSARPSNTILSLSSLQKYDHYPFLVCVVTPARNFLYLANTTFLKKIGHSSQNLSVDNIRGSFNGTDIYFEYDGVLNVPENFGALFSTHQNFTFEENLVRLVEETNNILPTGRRFEPSSEQIALIMDSVERATSFLGSSEFIDLNDDLNRRVGSVESEISVAALIENVNLRGRVIEYLITQEGDLKRVLMECLRDNKPLPAIFNADKLGDYGRQFTNYNTQTDIKTKIMFLTGNPKGYNIDKLLKFLSEPKSVYLIFIVAVDADRTIKTQLCSLFNRQLLEGTRIMQHWAGRSSRGVTQYDGNALAKIIEEFDPTIDSVAAGRFLKKCLEG